MPIRVAAPNAHISPARLAQPAATAAAPLRSPSLHWQAAATLFILAAALLRLLTAQVPLPVFDVDPMLAPGGQAGLAPGPSLCLDAMTFVAAAIGLVAVWRAGRGVHAWLVAAALVPAIAAAALVGGPIEQSWRGATWLSSVVGGVVLCHLLQERRLRRLALVTLLGGLAIVAVRGASQLLVEHPRMVESFGRLREAFLADRGWGDGAASVRVFEDRLRQREATAWFGLSNVFSSAMVAACLASTGLALAARRGGRLSAAGGTMAVLALGSLALLGVNGSKGALGALGAGAVVLALGVVARRVPGRVTCWLALGLPALALAAVVVRGALLPEGFLGERSLLFRWHYLVDAAAVIAAHPAIGVGPDGFQQAMVGVRPPHHAEEVVSAHNVSADWLVAFGAMGAAWIAVLVTILRWAGQAASDHAAIEGKESTGDVPTGFESARSAMACVLLVATFALWLEAGALDVALLLLRLLGIGAGLAVVVSAQAAQASASGASGGVGARAVRWGVFAAAVALVMHAQVEMTFWLAGSVPWAMAMLAVAGPAPGAQRRTRVQPALVAMLALALTVLAVVAATTGVATWRMEAVMRRAAQPLEQLGEAQGIAPTLALRTDGATIAALESALLGAGAPRETVAAVVGRLASASGADRAIAIRTLEEAMGDLEEHARLAAIATLEPASDGRDIRPVLVLAEQAVRASVLMAPQERSALLRRAESHVAYAMQRTSLASGDQRLLRARAEILEAMARSGDAEAAKWAMEAWRGLAVRDPCSLTIHLRLADSAARAGDRDAEVASLRRALELDEALRLDPRRRLTPEQRADIARRLAAATTP